jgi:hypothetical protein
MSPRGIPSWRSLLFLFLHAIRSLAAEAIPVDGTAAHHVFDGIGGLSAGASSRLLIDYPEPQRSDLLDLLYKPQHGAALQICKIEIGGDVMSTDGTEPSHAHFRGDLSCDRGYELWLASEAVKRNPAIATFGLSWGVPGWVGNGSYFTEDNMGYQSQFATCFLQKVGRPLDYIGVWNERYWGGTDYIVQLRAALDAAGHSSTRIVLPDNAVAKDAKLLAAIAGNATFVRSFDVAGLHGAPAPVPLLEAVGKKYWQSESGFAPINLTSDWAGAQQWARILTRNYVSANITATVTWSLLWSVLPGLPYDGRGIAMANTPWSGNFRDSAPLWVSAHWGQFTSIGWRYLLVGRGSGILPAAGGAGGDAGSYVALVPPHSLGDLTLIVETMGVGAPSTRSFALGGGLPGPGTVFQVWATTNACRFCRLADAAVGADGSLLLQLPADGVLTASTVRGAAHGAPSAPVPPPAPLPLPYADAFDAYAYDSLPRFLSDQGGSFAVRNGSLVQTVTQRPGGNDWYTTPDPITLLGDYEPWADVTVAARAVVPPPPPSQPRVGEDPNAALAPCEAAPGPRSDRQAWRFNAPYAGYLSNAAGGAAGAGTCLNLYGCTSRLIYYGCCQNCGCANSSGFLFSLQPGGALVAALLPGHCATVLADGATVAMAPCASPLPPTQLWAYNATSLQLVSAAARACLTVPAPPPPPAHYARLCARVTGYSGFKGLAPVPGYCLRVENGGAWTVTAGAATLANGTLPGGSGGEGAPLALELTAKGALVSARVGAAPLGAWPSSAFAGGMVALGCGMHQCAFDDFLLAPA